MLVPEVFGEQGDHALEVLGELLAVPRRVVTIAADHPSEQEPAFNLSRIVQAGLLIANHGGADSVKAATIAAPVSAAVRYGATACACEPLCTRWQTTLSPNCGRRSLTSATTSPASAMLVHTATRPGHSPVGSAE